MKPITDYLDPFDLAANIIGAKLQDEQKKGFAKSSSGQQIENHCQKAIDALKERWGPLYDDLSQNIDFQLEMDRMIYGVSYERKYYKVSTKELVRERLDPLKMVKE